MPEIIQFKNGNQIRNLYDAGGRKLKSECYTLRYPVIIPIGTIGDPGNANDCNVFLSGTQYLGNIEYAFSNDCGDYQFDLDKVYNTEGYVYNIYSGSTYQYNYYRKDHLGNNREVWNANTNTIIQRTQYYPSGLPWADGLYPAAQNRKYNNKEFIEAHGLDEYYSIARTLYPAILRTTTLDPLAEKYYSISPYAWCGNNPVRNIDPTGMIVETGSMTKTEQKEYDKMIALLNKSDLFKTFYSTLVKSDNVYTISFGETNKDKSGNSVPGMFKPDDKTDGGSVTFLKSSNLTSSTTIEELVHAYQNENKTLDNKNINPEFEAKTITQLVAYEAGLSYGQYDGMGNFQDQLLIEYNNTLTPRDVNSSKFQASYRNAAFLYSIYNRTNDIGNSHYKQLTLQPPVTLIKLFNNTFLKNIPWIK